MSDVYNEQIAEYELEICPSPAMEGGIEHEELDGQSGGVSRSAGTEFDYEFVINICPEGDGGCGAQHLFTLEICPQCNSGFSYDLTGICIDEAGRKIPVVICGCDYDANTVYGWSAGSLCLVDISLALNFVACNLMEISIVGSRSGPLHSESGGAVSSDPIYPLNDSRNPTYPAQGLSNKTVTVESQTLIPGENLFAALTFDDSACEEKYPPDGIMPVEPPIYFETTGFVGGTIIEIVDEDSRIYRVQCKGTTVKVYGSDWYEYAVGDWVALAKIGTDFPDGFPGLANLTNANVEKTIPDRHGDSELTVYGPDIYSSTTIGKSSLNMLTNEHQSKRVTIFAGTGKGQTRTITSNDGTTLTVEQAWLTTPDGTSAFSIYDGEDPDSVEERTIIVPYQFFGES